MQKLAEMTNSGKTSNKLSATEWNCSEWRSLLPSDTLNRLGKHRGKLVHVSAFCNFLDGAIQDLIMPCDLIVFQRNLVAPVVFNAITYFQGMGKPVAVDLDDAYPILPWSNPAHAFWIENSTKKEENPIVMLENGLAKTNGLIAPNRLLLSDWKHVTKGYHLPNFARGEWWSKVQTREQSKESRKINDTRVVIGWGGSVSHYDSWWGSGLREAATRISSCHPEVLWLICGNDKRIYDQLPVPWSSKAWQPGVPPEEWPNSVACFDIGVAPLFGPYDQRRSWIKGLEYILAGVPWVGTTGEPYSDIANLGTLVENSADNWEQSLEMIINNLKKNQDIAQERKVVGVQWYAENQEKTYEAVYGEIINSFRAHGSRLPDVAYVNWPQKEIIVYPEKKEEKKSE